MIPECPGLCMAEKEVLARCWAKVTPEVGEVGAEVMYRLLQIYPDTQSHFSHFDQSRDSPDLYLHGEKIMKAIGHGIKEIDNLIGAMASLPNLHTNVLKISPAHFKALSSVIQVTLARRYPQTFTPELHKALVKCLCRMADIMQTKPS